MKHVLSLLLVAALFASASAKDTGAAETTAGHGAARHHERPSGSHHPKGRGVTAAHKGALRLRQEDAMLEKENLMPVMPRALPATGVRPRKQQPLQHKAATAAARDHTKEHTKDLVPKPHKRGAKKFNVKKHAWKKNLHKDKLFGKKHGANKEFARDGHSLKDMLSGPRSKKRQIREKRAKMRGHKKSH